jgi:hypothetical protein
MQKLFWQLFFLNNRSLEAKQDSIEGFFWILLLDKLILAIRTSQ